MWIQIEKGFYINMMTVSTVQFDPQDDDEAFLVFTDGSTKNIKNDKVISQITRYLFSQAFKG